MAETITQNGQHVRPLVKPTNVNILNAIRNEGSSTYQRLVPSATQANIRESLENIMKYPNLRNEFYDVLANRIFGVYIHRLAWDNPMAEFKRASQSYGSTYEEAAVGLAKSIVYDPNQEYLSAYQFGTFKPEVKSVFHTVNRREMYPVTINDTMLRQAFLSGDDGLNQLTSQLMEAPRTTDNMAEYASMLHLLPEYARNGGYFRVQTPDVSDYSLSNGDITQNAQTLLRLLRRWISAISIKPDTRYNAAHMPVTVDKSDIVILMTPEVHAALDVNALAVLFNEEYAKTNQRIIDVNWEDIGIRGLQCILTVRQFFFCWDYLYQVVAAPQNAFSLGTNYVLHHQEAISYSPFAPALLFWTGPGTRLDAKLQNSGQASKPQMQIRIDKYGVNSPERPTSVERGGMVQVVSTMEMPGDPSWAPEGPIQYSILKSPDGSKPTSEFTSINPGTGVLKVGFDEQSTGIPVVAKAIYIDPEHPEVDNEMSTSLTVPVTGDGLLGLNTATITKLEATGADGGKTATVKAGETARLKVMATLNDGRVVNVANFARFETSDKTTADVADGGIVTGVKAGNVTVTAGLYNFTADITVTVTAATRDTVPSGDRS